MSFEWKTEEENDEQWQEQVADTARRSSPRRRHWLALLLTLVLAGSAAFLLYREGQQRIEESASLLEEDVLSSHRLGETAQAQGDLELFTTILSGRLPVWTQAQKERLEAGILYAQTARILGLESVVDGTSVPQVSFSPDLREATVTTEYAYLLPDRTISETVTLAQTTVYRQGTNRWLLSPPEAPHFWGPWRTRERAYVTLTYPTRDETIALRLARDLDEKVAEMCNRLDCPDEFQVRVRLERAPYSLLPLLDPEAVLTGRRTVVLPTPTLVGLPIDEAAYEALFNGYARRLLTALMVDLGDWECCEDGLFQQALLYRQLVALGVAPEPLTPVKYLSLLDQVPDRQQLQLWRREDDPVADPATIPAGVYAYLDFLLARQESDLFTLYSQLESVLATWIDQKQLEGEAEWVAFLQRRVERAQAEVRMPPGLSWPDQDLLLLCTADADPSEPSSAPATALYRYHPPSGEWTKERDVGHQFVMLTILPADDGFFLALQDFAAEADVFHIETYLERVGEEPVFVAGSEENPEAIIPWWWGDPPGEGLLAYVFEQGMDEVIPRFAVVDPDTCNQGGCRYEQVPGFPVWSPDGQQMVTMSYDEDAVIQRKSVVSTAWQEVARGAFPFWLDNQTYGFVAGDTRGEHGAGVYLSVVGEDEPALWLTEEMLIEAMPADSTRRSLGVEVVFQHPLAADRLLVFARTNRGQSELFVVESGPLVRHVTSFPGQLTGLPMMTGMVREGQPWLVLPLAREEVGLVLFDLAAEEILLSVETGPTFSQQSFDWSADQVWLAYPSQEAVALVAPGFRVDNRPYRHFSFHDLGSCSSVGWINQD